MMKVLSETGALDRPPQRRTVLSAKGLSRSFGGFLAVSDVDLNVEDQSIHALIGPNGAGKTTTFNLLTKFLPLSSGRIELMGEDISALGPAAVARKGLARSFQISSIFPHLTVMDNIRVALQKRHGLGYQFWRPVAVLNRLNTEADELLEKVGLTAERHRLATDMSYGRKRLLEIATTMALDPKVLLLDEPMAGIGNEDIDRVSELIVECARGRAVLMVEHNLKVVSQICDTITVLQRGQIIAQGDYKVVSNNEQVRLAYMGSRDD